MLSKVKLALKITTTNFDDDLNDLISAAVDDLGIAGVTSLTEETTSNSTETVYKPVVRRAIVTYCKMHFKQLDPQELDRLKKSYDEQKAQLVTATGYTDWGDS